jgi:hypothetical protein
LKSEISSVILVSAVLLLSLLAPSVSAVGSITLADYQRALRASDVRKIESIRAYVLGAVETHLMYSNMLSDWTQFNALCTGHDPLSQRELGVLLEIRINALRRRYGKDIMGMPIVEVIPSIVEEHYRCF